MNKKIKDFFKRFKLSEWLILTQLLLSSATLLLTTFLGETIIDIIGLAGNIINGIAILVVFSIENSRNVKYYELTGQFIFNKLGESFSSFMDFLMSEEYKKMPFDEHNVFHDKLLELAETDNYDIKRKISRALPYLYEIDKAMTCELVEILRNDMHNDRTDIRRRTLEAMVTIIQKQVSKRKRYALAKKFFKHFRYHEGDDSYTIVACIENFYFVYDFVFTTADDKQECLDAFAELKEAVNRAFLAQVGVIEESLCADMDNIWESLVALSALGDINRNYYLEKRKFIDNVIVNGAKFSKLAVVKNLYYTCSSFPECLHNQRCVASNSKYMMDKINRFLTNALDQDVFLAMPTVRYFDCVCNNICKGEARTVARAIIREYFSSEELIITQTAFDKFAKLLANDRDFAKEILAELLKEESNQVDTDSKQIKDKIDALPDDKKQYFSVETGRIKFKTAMDDTHRKRNSRSANDEIKEIDTLIKHYNERVRFIGKIKKFKEDHNL